MLLKGINDDGRDAEAALPRAAEAPGQALLPLSVRPDLGLVAFPHAASTRGSRSSQGLRGHTTGYAVPTYVIDAPGGGGKIPLIPDYVVGREGDDLILKNFEGNIYRYTDPDGTVGADRAIGAGQALMRVALVYDLRDDYRALGLSEEEVAEFDSVETIDQLAGALEALRLRGRSASAAGRRLRRGSSPANATISSSPSPKG